MPANALPDLNGFSHHAILDGWTVVPASLTAYVTWRATQPNRTVARERVLPGVEVKTVFLGLNYGRPGGSDEYFEPLVFGGPLADRCRRYATWDEAESGHLEVVRQVREAIRDGWEAGCPS
jgi:hypothetical protein